MERLNFAVIGAGRFGKHYIRNLQRIQGASLFGVAARTKETLDCIKGSVPSSAILTGNDDSLIKNKNVDCVVIAAPASTHFGLIKKTIEAGKNVLVEKPMVVNLKEAKLLRSIVKKHKSVFMVGHQYVYNDYIRHLQSSVKSGFIGKPNMVVAQYLYPEPIRSDIGCFWDAGTHYLSIIQHLFNPGSIAEVSGKSISTISKFDDFTSATIKFRSGLAASLIVSWIYPEKTRKFMVLGSKKAAVFDDVEEKGKLKYFPVSGKIKNNSVYGHFDGKVKSIIPSIKAKDSLRNELGHFIDCVRNKKKPLTDIDRSCQITEWLDTISRAIMLPGY
ncbi:Gfo/Idh/MocA family oxidoreductase [Candidatus Woesearchaeota archaeon]|nr:Gfo/Idh/MocA family oxidoreductase [Candidatus Woesearchaeota archaeon]